jgi:large subunit ribosomal protein L30
MYAVIRVRGTVNVNPDIKRTMQLMRLTRTNHCVLIEENPVYKGMLQIAKDYVTWGEIDKETLVKLITQRGKLMGDAPVTDAVLKASTPFPTIEKLADALLSSSFVYKDIPDVKPLFRLNPPKNGYRTVKRSFQNKGSLGYRKDTINKLIQRML